MFVTVSTTHQPATDLGHLLHKNPSKAQTFQVSAGQAHVFYPEASHSRCTAALLVEIDPIELVRKQRTGRTANTLAHYVNDRAYAASSLLAVALGKVFRTALRGTCAARPELAQQPIPLDIHLPALPCRGGPVMVDRMFAPLGWSVTAEPIPLDPQIPRWGDSQYNDVRLTGRMRLADALNHLYVLLPVLDNAKHYWVSTDEVDKLVRSGAGWLQAHPDRDVIADRYLAHKRSLVTSANERLADIEDAVADAADRGDSGDEEDPPPPVSSAPSLAESRRGAVLDALRSCGAARVADLGCGEGVLLRELLADLRFTEILGVDVSPRALQIAAKRLGLDRLPDRKRSRITLMHSSLLYRDERLSGYDAAVLMEVIEHIDPSRLATLERNVFGSAVPGTVVVTTPNAEFNARFEVLNDDGHRHADHRFEWSRAQFHDWADRVAQDYGYAVRYGPVGDEDPELGPPTQMAVFTRADQPQAEGGA